MAEILSNIASKEMIAARMFRHSVRYWELKETDIDNLDPLVRLLVEACAVELYRVSNEINSAQEHMLEKIARLLTPDVYTAPKPAHAIVHGRALEGEAQVYPLMQFFHQKKVASKPNGPFDTNIDVYFSPAGNYKVVDGDITIIAAATDLCTVNKSQFKEIAFKTANNIELEPNTLWLGLDLSYQVTDITGVSLFFDLKNHPAKRQLLPLLHYSTLYVNGVQVDTQAGLWNPNLKVPYLDSFTEFDEFNLNQTIERYTNSYYDDQFITIINAEKLSLETEKFPTIFAEYFSDKDLGKLQKKLLWIKVQLMPEFDSEVLEDLSVSINSFPVVNRYINETRYRLQNDFNIIPLLSTEQFLSLETVEGSDGGDDKNANKYTNLPFDNKSDIRSKGTYTLRTGDVERFDSRNATEYLNYLLELLRDESSAFAAFGQDFVASLIKDFKQNIAQLEQKIKQNITSLYKEPTYLLINPRKEGETIFVNFWTTNGEMGNLIRAGSKLELYQGEELQPESLIMVTGSSGGSNKLNKTELLNAYKNTLITRGRIVTLEDVKSFCRMTLGEKAKSIYVKKGVAIGILPNEGLINVIEILITPNGNANDEGEWNELTRDLQKKLEQQSTVTSNYRIGINKLLKR